MHPVLNSQESVGNYQSDEINPFTGLKYSDQYKEILEKRKQLPVYQQKDEILNKIRENTVVIVEGQTGSGKTTQIPQFILEEGICPPDKLIVCTQPRRVAASSIATRVSQEMDVDLGTTVGYTVRFDSKTSKDTRLIYMTDGLLMREFIEDQMLRKYGVVIIDEAHERTVNTDIILGLLKQLNEIRRDLKIVVMSATLDAEKFVKFFKSRDIYPPHIKVPGRMFNVTVKYSANHVPNVRQEVTKIVLDICQSKEPGDILVFLTGEEEIESICSTLRDKISATRRTDSLIDAEVLPLYAQLLIRDQRKVFEKLPNGTRKIVLATNIAETSITIDGIVYVIDSGYIKETHYSPASRKDSLIRVMVSRASADQRKGRAGRTRDGICYRLYTEEEYNTMAEQTTPEIQRSDLCDLVLLMIAAHVRDIVHFPFPDPPHYKLLLGAFEELFHLDVFRKDTDTSAIGQRDELTDTGRLMSRLPVSPKYSRALIAAHKYHCSEEVCMIVAILSEQGNVFVAPRTKKKEADEAHIKFYDRTGDHMTFVRVMREYNSLRRGERRQWAEKNFINNRPLDEAIRTMAQIKAQLQKEGCWSEDDDVRPIETRVFLAMLTGSFMQVARLSENGKYQVVINKIPAIIVRYSALSVAKDEARWVMFDELINSGEDDALRTVSIIDPTWCIEAVPTYFVPSNFPDGPIRNDFEYALNKFNAMKFGGQQQM